MQIKNPQFSKTYTFRGKNINKRFNHKIPLNREPYMALISSDKSNIANHYLGSYQVITSHSPSYPCHKNQENILYQEIFGVFFSEFKDSMILTSRSKIWGIPTEGISLKSPVIDKEGLCSNCSSHYQASFGQGTFSRAPLSRAFNLPSEVRLALMAKHVRLSSWIPASYYELS